MAASGKARVGIEAGVSEKEEARVAASPKPLLSSAVDVAALVGDEIVEPDPPEVDAPGIEPPEAVVGLGDDVEAFSAALLIALAAAEVSVADFEDEIAV